MFHGSTREIMNREGELAAMQIYRGAVGSGGRFGGERKKNYGKVLNDRDDERVREKFYPWGGDGE